MQFKDQVAYKTIGMIKRNFEYINKEAYGVLYGTLVRPQLEYDMHLWSPYQIGLREKLEQLQEEQQSLLQIYNKSYEEGCPH